MIDKKDKKILVELLNDGRKSFADLAKSCKMTRQSIFSRIKSLRRKGVIKNFTVNLDNQKLGLNIKAYILISAEPLQRFREKAIKTLMQIPQISQIHILFGRFDLLVEVMVRDINDLSQLLAKIHELEMIDKTETMIVYKNIKYDLQHPVENALAQIQ
jgi:Lrp/AsnC family transcriptional regulator for asnA, asnC and gidA